MIAGGLIQTERRHLDELTQGMRVVTTEAAVFRVEGTGAADCLQGLLTCDVVGPGIDSVTYGAMLTPKGMITVDFLIFRDGGGFTLVTELGARLAALDLFRRQLPPRFAKVIDRTDSSLALWLLGHGSESVARAAGLPWPDHPGRLAPVQSDAGAVLLGRPPLAAPWAAVVIGPAEAVRAVAERMEQAGGEAGTGDDREAVRILGGWPALSREIDQKTLPQEVRYDEIGGVSYTKGCYVGQETVARVHFRGHVNRLLRGLRWTGPAPSTPEITHAGKPVGQLTSGVQLERGGAGLGLIRRDVQPGSVVRIGASEGVVVALPFDPPNGEAPDTGPGASSRQ